ncbi:hypothetical protein CB0101_11455 [Synechococcus sp. CB0101]|uniref:hypothetical protein n=1 Tax=Synechococcus sp. CB0101 TaxID=232348 RepID=UPI0002002252|nr:hypothetical protein [Synechococcus sp. CB0101]QCH15457.1 hypothetical protein CB0101_11455 [Synechococcus sp. CB0101]
METAEMAWKSLKQGEELAESLLNTDEDDGTNNGKQEVDSTNTAHVLMQLKERANLKPLRERLEESESAAKKRRQQRRS